MQKENLTFYYEHKEKNGNQHYQKSEQHTDLEEMCVLMALLNAILTSLDYSGYA